METTPLPFSEQGTKLIKFPDIRTSQEIHTNRTLRRDDVILGLLKRGSKMAVGGASKARKTWLLMHLGVCVSQGQEWLDTFETKQTKVLYVNFELHDDVFEHRLETICSGMEISSIGGLGEWFSHWGLRGYAAGYESILPVIKSGIKERGYGLIILDPMYKILGDADENKAGDITKMFNALDDIAFEHKVSIVTSNHYSKGNKSSAQDGDRISGSGVFQRDPDSLVEFVDQEESDENNNILSVRPRLREHIPFTPFCVEWDGKALFVRSNHDARKLKKTNGKPATPAEELLKGLSENGLTTTEWQKEMADEHGMSRAMFYRLKPILEASGKVKKSGNKFVSLIGNETCETKVSHRIIIPNPIGLNGIKNGIETFETSDTKSEQPAEDLL
jgi:hypothetical protein